jgi:hypothetical protein
MDAVVTESRHTVYVFFFETAFYLHAVYTHSANWCEYWVLWLGEGYSVVPFHSYLGYEPGEAWGDNTYI